MQTNTLVELLVHLNIAAQIPSTDTSRKEYFFPAVLRTAEMRMLLREIGENEEVSPEPLCIRFTTGYIPLGFVCALGANLIGEQNFQLIPFKEGDQSVVYKNMMKFRFNGEIDIVMVSTPKYCEFRVSKCTDVPVEFWDNECCPLIKTIICRAANKVVRCMQHGSLYKPLKGYELSFKCPKHPNAVFSHEPLARLDFRISSERIQCVHSECGIRSCLTPEMNMWFGMVSEITVLFIINRRILLNV